MPAHVSGYTAAGTPLALESSHSFLLVRALLSPQFSSRVPATLGAPRGAPRVRNYVIT